MSLRSMVSPLILATLVACSDSTEPVFSLAGTWDMVAFREGGIDATDITGTIEFASNGTVTVVGAVTFPGEPADDIGGTGTWSQTGASLSLSMGGDIGTWSLDFDGENRVVLQLQGDASASRLTLERQ